MSRYTQPYSASRYILYTVMWSLAIMTLMRLVWMQRRTYQPELTFKTVSTVSLIRDKQVCDWPAVFSHRDFARFGQESVDLLPKEIRYWFSASGLLPFFRSFCQIGPFDVDKAIRTNQWIWVATVFFCALAMRLLGQSWLVCLLVATTLMSRGKFIAMNSVLGTEIASTLFFSVSFCLLLLFVRSSSWWALSFFLLSSFIGMFFEKSLFILTFAILFMSVFTRILKPVSDGFKDEGKYASWLQLFRDRNASWAAWNNVKGHWLKISWWSGVFIILELIILIGFLLVCYEGVFGDINLTLFGQRMAASFQDNPLSRFVQSNFQPMDAHYLFSFVIVLGISVRGSLNRHLVWGCRIFLLTAAMLLLASLGFDLVDHMFFMGAFDDAGRSNLFIAVRSRESVYWSEPILISLGIASLFQLVAYDLRFIFRADK